MLEYIKEESSLGFTENGAVSYNTTKSDCLDLFVSAGASRNINKNKIWNNFNRAYIEDPDTAVKILFFARDIRGGLGEKRFFRTIINKLAFSHPETVRKNIEYIQEVGRYDDLLSLYDTPCEEDVLRYIAKKFKEDLNALDNNESISLLSKWLPSINASSAKTRKNALVTASYLELSPADYRKTLSRMRKKLCLIENNLREKDYTFDYSSLPSRALFKYNQAFMRNDDKRYMEFIDNVNSGKTHMNTKNLLPYEIVEKAMKKSHYDFYGNDFFLSSDEKKSLNASWNALPDYMNDENIMTVIDTSGSMYMGKPMPLSVALSLGLYAGERNKGIFKNHFIMFSKNPRLIKIKGETFVDRFEYILSFSEIANTNIDKVFNLILNTAIKHKVPQEELPSKIVIISDMEFDACVDNPNSTNYANAKKKYEEAGYHLPQTVFWNTSSRNGISPVNMNENGTILISGVTPKIFEMVTGNLVNPYVFMQEILSSERYKNISA